MCGIVAIISPTGNPAMIATLRAMTDIVRHRGPDADGQSVFTLGPTGSPQIITEKIAAATLATGPCVGLGHQRLSILDLSAAGQQPMPFPTPTGPYWLVFNGEIYNFVELRDELKAFGHTFRTGTDSEVVLAAYAQWGPECVTRFNGMWAFALLDGPNRCVFVCRDRLGIKPLYWANVADHVLIVSEIKQLTAFPGFIARPETGAVADYLLTGYERTDRTFFAGVTPVPGGTWVTIDLATGHLSPPTAYWRPETIAEQPTWTRPQAAEQLQMHLTRAVRWQLRSDVPVGCTLSGGLDSSAVARFVADQHASTAPLATFTAAFPGEPIDEAPYAKMVAQAVGAVGHETQPTATGFLADVDRLIWHHDEPIGSLAMYGAFCLARTIRQAGVPVVLNGQGGDEVLGGYWQSYLAYLRRLAMRGRFVALTRHVLGSLLGGGNPLLVAQFSRFWRRLRARRQPPMVVVPEVAARASDSRQTVQRILDMSDTDRRLHEIRELHLPRLLKWDDRNLMAFSVEGRYPFLDHELIEWCLSLPPDRLYSRGWTKLPLRDAIAGRLPSAIVQRKTKWGFVTPQTQWLQGPLKPAMLDFVASPVSPVWDWADRDSARRVAAIATRVGNRAEEPAQTLFRLFALDRWLHRFWP